MAKRRMLPAIRGDRSLLPCIHVDDAASATVAALERGPAGRTYDIVDDEPVSFSEIVRALAEAAGAPRPIAVPLWLPRLVAPYMARMISLQPAAVQRRRRAPSSAGGRRSDDPRRACADGAPGGLKSMTEIDLFQTHRPALFAVAYRMLGSATDAEDVLQDAWLRFSSARARRISDPPRPI